MEKSCLIAVAMAACQSAQLMMVPWPHLMTHRQRWTQNKSNEDVHANTNTGTQAYVLQFGARRRGWVVATARDLIQACMRDGRVANTTISRTRSYFTRTKPFDDAEMLSCSTEELLGCGAGREISISEDNTAAGVPEQK